MRLHGVVRRKWLRMTLLSLAFSCFLYLWRLSTRSSSSTLIVHPGTDTGPPASSSSQQRELNTRGVTVTNTHHAPASSTAGGLRHNVIGNRDASARTAASTSSDTSSASAARLPSVRRISSANKRIKAYREFPQGNKHSALGVVSPIPADSPTLGDKDAFSVKGVKHSSALELALLTDQMSSSERVPVSPVSEMTFKLAGPNVEPLESLSFPFKEVLPRIKPSLFKKVVTPGAKDELIFHSRDVANGGGKDGIRRTGHGVLTEQQIRYQSERLASTVKKPDEHTRRSTPSIADHAGNIPVSNPKSDHIRTVTNDVRDFSPDPQSSADSGSRLLANSLHYIDRRPLTNSSPYPKSSIIPGSNSGLTPPLLWLETVNARGPEDTAKGNDGLHDIDSRLLTRGFSGPYGTLQGRNGLHDNRVSDPEDIAKGRSGLHDMDIRPVTNTVSSSFEGPGPVADGHHLIWGPEDNSKETSGFGDIDNRLLTDRVSGPEDSPAAERGRSSSSSSGSSGTCSAIQHVAFLKVHKAASSTVASLLQRYGYTRNLSFALPNKEPRSHGYNYITRPGEPFVPAAVLPPPPGRQRHHDILWNHAVYNRSAFRTVMPPDAVYVTMLREPFQHFVSAFAYYKLKGKKKPRGGRRRGMRDDDEDSTSSSAAAADTANAFSRYLHNESQHSEPLNYFRNKQAQDLGMTEEHVRNATLRRGYIQQLGEDLQLVMITDFFDESLVLLRRLLCWSVKDILYIGKKNRNANKPSLVYSAADYSRHRQMSAADYELYEFFRRKFLRTLAAQDVSFEQEVSHFREVLWRVQQFCERVTRATDSWPAAAGDRRAPSREQFFVPRSPWSDKFVVTSHDCELLGLPELAFLNRLLAARLALGDLFPASEIHSP